MQSLVTKSIVYNFENGFLAVDFAEENIPETRALVLQQGSETHSAEIETLTQGTRDRPARHVAVFKNIWIKDPGAPLTLASLDAGQPRAVTFLPANQTLRHAPGDAPTPVTLLASFPRSGSNFTQNIIRENTSGLCNTSIYAGGRVTRPAFLKSHATAIGAVRNELRELWDHHDGPAHIFALIRDPRDVFISAYDFVANKFGEAPDATRFLNYDYYRCFFDPPRGEIVRYKRMLPLNLMQAYRLWVRHWIVDAGTNVNILRFEDLTSSPNTAFEPLFTAFHSSQPASLGGLTTRTAQYGDSLRQRAAAGGWRDAPQAYHPIIDAVEKQLADEIDLLNYR